MLDAGREENNNCVEIVSNSQQQNSQKQQQKFPVLDVNQLQYSDKYFDDKFEYRHIILPKEFSRYVPRTHLMTETEWRNLGIQQSPGWVHYLLHAPEPHVLMFRRLIQTVEKHQALLCTEDDSEDEEGEDLEEIEELEASDVTEMELDPDDEDYEEGEEYRGCC